MAYHFNSLLEQYHANTLRAIATYCGIDTAKPIGSGQLSKRDLVSKMAKLLLEKRQVDRTYKRLGKGEREVLERVLRYDDPILTSNIKHELLRAGLVTEREEPSQYSYRAAYEANPNSVDFVFENVLARLMRAGLLFSHGEVFGGGTKFTWYPGEKLVIPNEIRRALPKPRPLVRPLKQWTPEEHETGNPLQFLRELYLYWRALRPKPLPLLKSGAVGKRALKEINSHLLRPIDLSQINKEEDSFKLCWLRQMLTAQGLLTVKQNMLHAKYAKFWNFSLGKQIATVLATWASSSTMKDLPASIEVTPIYSRARQSLMTILGDLPQGWLNIVQVIEQTQRTNADFLFDRSHLRTTQRYYYSYQVDARKAQQKRYDKLEQQFIRRVLKTIFLPLGIVELGLGDYEGSSVEAVKVTEFGRAVLRQKQAIWPSIDQGRIVVQPSFQILALGAVEINKLIQLDRMAEPVSIDPNVFEYRLTRDSIYNALQAELSAAQITTFLSEQTGQPLPQNVQRSIQEWGTRHERIVFRTDITLLQTATAQQLTKLLAQRSTKNLIARQLNDTLAFVHLKKQQTLVSRLVKSGELPAVGEVDIASTNHSVTITSDGLLTPIHAIPNLLLIGRLTKIAQPVGSSWQLTEQSIKHVAKNKQQVEELIAELHSLASGALPEETIAQIKQWGGYFGTASAETVTLIEFQDVATLQQLLQLDTLKPYLTPFAAGDRALAVITKGKLKVVKQTLATLGIRIKSKLPR